MNEFKQVGLLGALAGRMHHNFHGAAVWQQSEIFFIPFNKSHLIEKGIGRIEIKTYPGVCILLAEKGTLRQDGIGTGKHQAEINHLIDFFTIDPE